MAKSQAHEGHSHEHQHRWKPDEPKPAVAKAAPPEPIDGSKLYCAVGKLKARDKQGDTVSLAAGDSCEDVADDCLEAMIRQGQVTDEAPKKK